MRLRALLVAGILAACGGGTTTSTTTMSDPIPRAASEYAASAMRALDGTAFEVLDVVEVADAITGLCEGLGVGAIGVAAADTGIVASEDDVAIFLEVLRRGLDQVCNDRVVIDLTAIYLGTLEQAIATAGSGEAFDEVAAIRAAPVVCEVLASDAGAEAALLAAAHVMFGVTATSVEELSIDATQGLVAGAVLGAATALLCPERVGEVETFMESL